MTIFTAVYPFAYSLVHFAPVYPIGLALPLENVSSPAKLGLYFLIATMHFLAEHYPTLHPLVDASYLPIGLVLNFFILYFFYDCFTKATSEAKFLCLVCGFMFFGCVAMGEILQQPTPISSPNRKEIQHDNFWHEHHTAFHVIWCLEVWACYFISKPGKGAKKVD